MKEPSLIYSGSVFLSSQLHQSQTSCTELLVGHCSLGLALFTGLPPIQFLTRFTVTTSTARGTEHAYFSVKGEISNNFRSDSVNEDVIFAIGMSLAFVGSEFRNMLSKTNISNTATL